MTKQVQNLKVTKLKKENDTVRKSRSNKYKQ